MMASHTDSSVFQPERLHHLSPGLRTLSLYFADSHFLPLISVSTLQLSLVKDKTPSGAGGIKHVKSALHDLSQIKLFWTLTPALLLWRLVCVCDRAEMRLEVQPLSHPPQCSRRGPASVRPLIDTERACTDQAGACALGACPRLGLILRYKTAGTRPWSLEANPANRIPVLRRLCDL